MRLADLDYPLDPARVAQTPVEPRDAARLLVDRGSGPAEHRFVRDLPDLLRPGDVVVVNETRVIPARLRLRRATGGASEVLLLEPRGSAPGEWEALIRPAARLRPGERLFGDDGAAVVEVGARTAAGDTFAVALLAPDGGPVDAFELMVRYGEMPLPPYIRTRLTRPERYQTVYATTPGSAAAPTAGLHLTPDLIARLGARGIPVVPVELVVGLDTFAPVTEADPLTHRMHSERYRVPAATWETVRAAGRVVAVGTTSVRALESVSATGELEGRTTLFLHAGAPVTVVDVVMTNFHQPRTTLLMLVEAVIGPRWRRLYAEAHATGYRFLSFGDATLLDRHAP